MNHDHRRLGVESNNRAWDLIDRASRTPAEDREMMAAAHTSYLHWSKAGTAVNLQRAEATIARVYAALGHVQPALYHLDCAERLARQHAAELHAFDLAMTEAIAARVHALAKNTGEAELRYGNARHLGGALGADGRRVLLGDLAQPPWFGFSAGNKD